MDYVAQGQTIGCALPALRVFTIFANSTLLDAEVVEYRIVDSAGVEVFPTPAGGPTWESLDVSDCPVGARLGPGQYVATGWTVDASQAPGEYTVQWRYKQLLADATFVTINRPFEVIGAARNVLAPVYGSIAELRAEGVTESDADDAALHRIMARTAKLIERWTKRQFYPVYKSVRYNGSGGRKLLIDDPIIAIEGANITTITTSLATQDETPVDRSLYFIYNRHIVSNLESPDDRNSPKLEYFHGRDLHGHSRADAIAGLSFSSLVWPSGPQLVRVSGIFGYTEYDGSALGQTPDLLVHAANLLTIRNLHGILGSDKQEDAERRWRLISEKTRDQEYKLADLSTRGAANSRIAVGSLTGDPAIDNILILFMRPPRIRAV